MDWRVYVGREGGGNKLKKGGIRGVSGFIGKLGKLEKTKFNKNFTFTILTFIELIIFSKTNILKIITSMVE